MFGSGKCCILHAYSLTHYNTKSMSHSKENPTKQTLSESYEEAKAALIVNGYTVRQFKEPQYVIAKGQHLKMTHRVCKYNPKSKKTTVWYMYLSITVLKFAVSRGYMAKPCPMNEIIRTDKIYKCYENGRKF